MRISLRSSLSCVVMALFIPVSAAAAGNLQVLGLSGEEVLDDGYGISQWGLPVLNDRGDMAVWVETTRLGEEPSESRSSMIRTDGRSIVQIVHEGQEAPDERAIITSINGMVGDGGTVHYQINNTGRVAFVGDVGQDRFASTNSILYGDERRLVELAPRVDPASSGTVSAAIGRMDNLVPSFGLNNSGQVGFVGRLWSEDGDVSRAGVVLASEDEVEVLALTDDLIGPTSFRFGRFISATLNEQGEVAFVGDYGPDPVWLKGILHADSTNVVEIAGLGRTDPENQAALLPTTISNWEEPVAMNDRGEVVFKARTLPAGGPDNTGIFVSRGDQLLKIAETGSRESGAEFGGFFRFSPRLNNEGQAALLADGWLDGEGDQPVTGVFRIDEDGPHLIAHVGQEDPRGIGTFYPLEAPNINDRGQIVFAGRVQLPGGNRSQEGIYFYDDELGLQTVVQAGDVVDGQTIRSVGGTFEGYQANLFDSGLNHFGQVAFAFTTEQGQEGIAIWSPYPTGDFTADSAVDQADLDLVLSIWGVLFDDLPPAWQSNPPGAIVDQAELDAVLRNWGATGTIAAPLPGAVPEPSGIVLLLAAILAAVAVRKRLKACT